MCKQDLEEFRDNDVMDLKIKDDRLFRDRKVCDIDGEVCQRIVFDIGESN